MALLFCCFLTLANADEPSTRIRNLPKITKSRAIAVNERATTLPTTTTTTSTSAQTLALASSTEAVEVTTDSINDICIHGIKAVIVNSEEETTMIKNQNDLVEIIEGDIMISVITRDTVSAMFVINRLNVANLLEANFEVGEFLLTTTTRTMKKNSNCEIFCRYTRNCH